VKASYDSFQIEIHTFADSVIHELEEVLINEGTVCGLHIVYVGMAPPFLSSMGRPKPFTTPNIPAGTILDSHLLKKIYSHRTTIVPDRRIGCTEKHGGSFS
jgi:hypothetical protein